MSRDLLYKPTKINEDLAEAQKPAIDKLGNRVRGKDIGGEEIFPKPAADDKAVPGSTVAPQAKTVPIQQQQGQQSSQGGSDGQQQKAFQAAYFNKDVVATQAVNQRVSNLQALRGADQILDLRKITLPEMVSTPPPDPAQLQAILSRLQAAQSFDMQQALAKQSAWTRAKERTAEEIGAWQAALQARIERRVRSLARLAGHKGLPKQPTLHRAATQQGGAMDEDIPDIMSEANELADSAAKPAGHMLKHLQKMLNVKKR